MHCNYVYPAKNSAGSERVAEALVKGFVKLGHEIVMHIDPNSIGVPVPIVTKIPQDFDIVHCQGEDFSDCEIPFISTVHGGGSDPPDAHWKHDPHFVCVSDFICKLVGKKQFVHSCVEPDDFIYKNRKEDYFLWISGTDWGEGKSLFTTILLAKKMGFKLKLAGTGKNQQIIDEIKKYCNSKIEYLGAVNGKEKAELIASAKAVILYTRLPDACPLVVAESLISGTPIIGSINGSLPELIVHNQTGILCKNENELPRAVASVSKIKPEECRQYALKHFSNIVACEKYLKLYKNVIEFGNVNGKE